jgi:hypothetical protein
MRSNPLLATVGATALICAIAPPVLAQTLRVGRLLCASTPRLGRVLGSTQSLHCVFQLRDSSRT